MGLDPELVQFGARIVSLRESRGMNRTELSKATGIKYTTLRNYEEGRREPGHDILIILADYFGVKVDYLVGRDSNENDLWAYNSNLIGMLTQLTPDEERKVLDYIRLLLDARREEKK